MNGSLLILLLLLFMTVYADAQGYDQYSRLKTSHNIKTYSDFNLNGKVKAAKTFFHNGNKGDTTSYLFNSDGKLVFSKIGSSSETYEFNQETLISIRQLNPISDDSCILSFGSHGMLENEHHYTRRGSYLPPHDRRYTYIGDSVITAYVFRDSVSPYYPQRDVSVYAFDDHQRPVTCRTGRQMDMTITWQYDSNGNLIRCSMIEDCALTVSSNSCLNLITLYHYDQNRRLTGTSSFNLTVTNSIHDYSSGSSFRYNEHGDIVVEYEDSERDNRQILHMIAPGTPAKKSLPGFEPHFEYDYDKYYNWIRKYNVTPKGKKLIARRSIEYFL